LFLFKGYDEFVIGEELPWPPLPLLMGPEFPLAIPGLTLLPASEWQVEASIMHREHMPEDALAGTNPWQAYLDLERTGKRLTLRGRRTGDRFQPLGMAGKEKALTAFMIDAKIPQHIRDHVPLVATPHHIAWVAGWRVDERVKVTKETVEVLRLKFLKGQ
jgi:tRNA(Ile)-lysidine synthase